MLCKFQDSGSRDNPHAYGRTWNSHRIFSESIDKYICEPPEFLVACLGNVPLILGSLGDSFELAVDLSSEFSLIESVPEFILIVDTVDGLALFPHLHEQIGVVIGFFGVEVGLGRLVNIELFTDFLADCLLVQALPVDSHLLNDDRLTETGSLILAF